MSVFKGGFSLRIMRYALRVIQKAQSQTFSQSVSRARVRAVLPRRNEMFGAVCTRVCARLSELD